MGNTLGLAPMGALPRRSPRREEPLPNPGSFDELHRLCKGEQTPKAFGRLALKGQRRAGRPVTGAEKGRSQLGLAASGRIRHPHGVEHFLLQDLRGGQFLQSTSVGLKGETTWWGRGSLSAYSSPSPSPPFRCIPSTDGGSEARCQQGSEQPFPGAPTSPAPPYYSSLPVPGSSPFLLCAPLSQAIWGKGGGVCGPFDFLCLWDLLLLIW